MSQSRIDKDLAKMVTCKISSDKETLDHYSVDASSYILKPSVVLFPRNVKEIIRIINYASTNDIPVTARGGGTGLVGSSLGTGIILDMQNFNKIEIGKDHVDVESGVFKGMLDVELKRRGKFLGPNPSIGPFCTVGGMISTNASGSHSLKYGSMIDNLILVKIITSKGEIITLPKENKISKKLFIEIKPDIQEGFPHVSKNSCGYLIDKIKSEKETQKIIAGSEGTLGIVVSARLKIFPIPKKIILIVIGYRRLRDAILDVPRILDQRPSALELIDKNIIKNLKAKIPRGINSILFVEFDDNVKKNLVATKKLSNGKIIKSITNSEEIDRWWQYRNSALYYSLQSISKQETMPSLIEDATVPVNKLHLLLDSIDEISSKYGMRVIVYGHAGNGNLHIRPVLKRKDKKLIRKIASQFFKKIISMGGSISGEHGDGFARSEFVRKQYGPKTYLTFKKIKQILDPQGILNPGKIISKGSTMTKNLKF